MTKSKGFTLIELLVVIAIVAVLAVVVILTLNPAELLRQARDSNRVSDAATMKSAMALYLADVASPAIGTFYDFTPNAALCFASFAGPSSTANNCSAFAANFTASTTNRAVSTTVGTNPNARNVDGTGWFPVNFLQISSKSPIASLPVDPVNNNSFYYAYAASGSATVAPSYKFVIMGVESQKYAKGQSGDVVSTDGGNLSNSIEIGSNLGL